MATSSENPLPEGLHTQRSTEELCKEAAEKLGTICSDAAGNSQSAPSYADYLQRHQKATATPSPIQQLHVTTSTPYSAEPQEPSEPPPPPYTPAPPTTAPPPSSACQIPLTDPERRDCSTSIVVPPPPPPSPGTALIAQLQATLSHTIVNPSVELPHQTSNPYPGYPMPYSVPNPAVFPPHGQHPYVISAPPPQIVCIQAPQQSAPTNSNSNNQNVNTNNIVIENKIGGDDVFIPDHSSYIVFSVLMFLLCLICNPLVLLLCIVPACIASLVVCCESRRQSSNTQCGRHSQQLALRQAERNKATGDFALACNIIGLICGILGIIAVVVAVPLAYLSYF